jgi:hypothetical protein
VRLWGGVEVGLTVLGRPCIGLTHGVRHIIAARDEARPHVSAEGRGRTSIGSTADQRDAGPYLARTVFAGGWGLAVGGLERLGGVAGTPLALVSSCPRVLVSS